MDSVMMNHLANPPILPPSPMPPPARMRQETGITEQNLNFLVESNRIQNELQVEVLSNSWEMNGDRGGNIKDRRGNTKDCRKIMLSVDCRKILRTVGEILRILGK